MPTYRRVQVYPEGTAIVDLSSVRAIYPWANEGYSIIMLEGEARLVVKGVPDQVAADFGFEVEDSRS